MDSHDYLVAHFGFIRNLASSLKQLPAQILNHTYSFESFDSWGLTLRYRDRVFRFCFDGRDNSLTLEQSDTSKAPYAWADRHAVEPAHPQADLNASICNALLQSDAPER